MEESWFPSKPTCKDISNKTKIIRIVLSSKSTNSPFYLSLFNRPEIFSIIPQECKWKMFVPLLYIKRKPALSLIVIEYCILPTFHDVSSSRFEICYEYLISPRLEEKEKKEKKKLLEKRST